jgi:hypothetical protein
MADLARIRWDGAQADEKELREFYETQPLDRLMAAHEAQRKMFEIASELLNKRVQAESKEVCSNCGLVFTRDVRWFHRDPVKNLETGIVTNVFSCSQACYNVNKAKTQTGFRKF